MLKNVLLFLIEANIYFEIAVLYLKMYKNCQIILFCFFNFGCIVLTSHMLYFFVCLFVFFNSYKHCKCKHRIVMLALTNLFICIKSFISFVYRPIKQSTVYL